MSRIYGPGPGRAPALRAVGDLAGMPVEDALGQRVGALYGSLADADTGLLRYVDVSLDGEDRHVLVPIGHVRVDDGEAPRVRLQAAVREDLRTIPTYDPGAGPPDDEHQRAVLAAHGRVFYGERYYAHPAYDHSGLYAGDQPIVADRPDETAAGPGEDGGPEPPRLRVLSGRTGFRVAPGEPDIRGRTLVAGDGRAVGPVRDLIFDPDTRKVRYAVVRRDDAADALVPVGYVRIEADVVRVPALDSDDVAALPAFAGEPVTREVEQAVRRRLDERLDGDRRFGRPDFNGGARPDQSRKKPTPSGPSARSST